MTSAPHLLIVDDDEDILSLLTKFFRMHSHQVTVAADGTAMFAALERHPINLVILDLRLRGEDGLSLCRRPVALSRRPPKRARRFASPTGVSMSHAGS